MYGGILRWRGILAGRTEPRTCPTLSRQLSVLADGTFAACPALCAEPLGMLGRDKLSDAWKKLCSSHELLARRIPEPECGSCRYAGICCGFCAGVMLSELKDSWRNFCLRRHVAIYGSEL